MNPDFPSAIAAIIQRVTETFASANPYPNEALPASSPEFERWFDEGVRIIEQGEDPALGVEAFTKALEIDAENYPALDNRARLYAELGENENAVADLIKVLQRAPASLEALLRLGEALAGLEASHLAARVFAATILLLENPAVELRELIAARPHLGLARVRLAAGDTELAQRLVQQALVVAPDSAEAFLLKADIHSTEMKPEEALICLNQALAHAEGPAPGILVRRAKVLRALGEEAAAARDFAETLRSLEDDPMATHGLAVTMMDAEQADWALEAVNRVIVAHPDFAEAHKIRGYLLAEEDPEKALEDLQRSVELDPETDDAWNLRAGILQGLGRLDEAVIAYDRAIEVNPEYIDAMIGLGNLHFTQKRYREALVQFQMVLKLEEHCPDAIVGRALIFIELGDFERALKDSEQVLARNPEHLLARLLHGEALLETCQYDAAIAGLEGCIDLCPEESKGACVATIATAHLRRGDTATASSLLGRVREIATDDDTIWSALAELHLIQGNTRAAQDAIRAAIAIDSSEFWYHELEGDILKASGDLSAARRSYAAALEIAPGRLSQERLRDKSKGKT